MIVKTIKLDNKHVNWIESRAKNLSKYVRQKIDGDMELERSKGFEPQA